MGAFDGVNAPTIKIQFYFNGAWTDVPRTDLRSLDIYRGRTRSDQRIDAGQLIAVLDNRSGDYDPDNLSGPWVTAGVTALRADLKVRVVATWSSTSYQLYNGYLETTKLDAGFDATATMTFVDGIMVLGRYSAPVLKTASYSGETTSTRVGRMLTYAGWGTGSSYRDLTGSVQLAATTQGNANAPVAIMDFIYQAEDAEAGCFYISRNGVATLVNLVDKFTRPTQLTFTDQQVANTVEYDEIDTNPGIFNFINAALVNFKPKNVKTTQALFKNKPSVTKYGLKIKQFDTEILTLATANKLAQYYATFTKNPKTWCASVGFNVLGMNAYGDLYPDFLQTELQDLCIVKRTTVDGRNLTFNLTIEGFRHSITANSWRCTYYTSPISATRVILP